MDPPQEGHQSQPQPQQQLEQQQEQITMNIESPVTDEETTKRIKSFKIYHYCLMIVIALLITNGCFDYYLNVEKDRLNLIIASNCLLLYSFPVVIQLLLVRRFIRANASDKSRLIQKLRCLSIFQAVFYPFMTLIALFAFGLSCLPYSGVSCDYSGEGIFFRSLSLFSVICFINSYISFILTT